MDAPLFPRFGFPFDTDPQNNNILYQFLRLISTPESVLPAKSAKIVLVSGAAREYNTLRLI